MPPKNDDFTLDQAQDLADYFIGPPVRAVEIRDRVALGVENGWHNGDTWRDAFRAAGVKLPFRKQYVNVGPRVLLDDEQVAICKSNTFAQRTAAALNAYVPGPSGV